MSGPGAAAMEPLDSKRQQSQNPGPSCALWPVDLKVTHMDWNPDATLIHFQGQYLTICELDYNILQVEIQNTPKIKVAVDVGELCLVEDLTSDRWFRGRVQNRQDDLFDVFLIDHGNILSVDVAHVSSCSDNLFILPPKIVCGFLANVLLLQSCSHAVMEEYFSNLIGKTISGDIQALLPHKVLLLEAPGINSDLVKHGFGRHVDTDTFLLLVEMLTEVPLQQNIEPVPDLLIENPRGRNYCFKLPGLQGFRDTLSFCRPRLECGTRAKVRVSAAVNPRLFHCQMATMKRDLWEMSKKLASVHEYRPKDSSQKTPENLGQLCSVKSKDGNWHRGYVQCLPINSQVRVFFIDYGFFETVKVENVHRLPPDVYTAPIMAFPCSLSCLSEQDEAVKPQQLSLLRAGLLGGLLDVEIRSFDEEQHLYKVTFIDFEDTCVVEPEPLEELPRKVESVPETGEWSPQGGYLYYETFMEGALGKTLEAEELQEDSVFVGYVEHVENPNHFWIRTQKRNDEFEEMMMRMMDHFSEVRLEEDTLLNPQLGALCCAVYEKDMHFYRGVVMDILEHGAEVLFIDFGNVEKVPHMLIKKIPEAFASVAAFSFCCTLVNVLPLDEVWTCAVSDVFRQAVSNKALMVRVVQLRRNKLLVDLCDLGLERSISELLTTSEPFEIWKVTSKSAAQRNTVATEKQSQIHQRTKQSESHAEEEIDQKSISFKPLSIRPGQEFSVQCSIMESSSVFWCQPKDPALDELMDKIQQHYSTNTIPLQPGVPCCVAKSPVDGRWYRAFITDRRSGLTRVLLIDYGLTVQLEERHLQAIKPEYVDLEGQAFRCRFSVEPTDCESCWNWGPEAWNSVKKFVHASAGSLICKVFSQVTVEGKGLFNVVELFNSQSQQNITSWLAEQGLATKATKQLSTASPETFVYDSYDLSPGTEEQVFVTHISNQWEVYCHLERNTELIEELEKSILEEREKIMKSSTRTVAGKLCLAKYLDGKWYRGLAHAVQSPLHVSVLFVDYGNQNICQKTHVTSITRDAADLLHTPMQALRLRLAAVPREELYADVTEWLDRMVLGRQVKAAIRGRSVDGSFDAVLFDGDVNVNEKVKQLILRLTPKPESVSSVQLKKKEVENPYKGNAKRPLMYTSQHQGKSDTKKCAHGKVQNNNSKMKCQKNKTMEGRHKISQVNQQKDKDTKAEQQQNDKAMRSSPKETHNTSQVNQQKVADTKAEQQQNTNETEAPQLLRLPDKNIQAGLRAKCFVSHINSVSSFFLHLSEDEPSILKMCEDLNSCSPKSVKSVRINDLVVALYEEDGALYRSVVRDSEGGSGFTVEFVDYGNSAVVEKEKLYLIPEEHLSQPPFSIFCCLLDTSSFESDASFTDAVMEKPVVVDFVCQHGTQWKVKMEILDAEVGLPATLQEVVKPGPDDNKEEESPVTEMEQDVTSEQNHVRKEISVTEATTSETVVQSVKGQNVLLPKELKVKTCQNIAITRERGVVQAINNCTEAEREDEDAVDNLYTSPPQKLVFAPIDLDTGYFGFAAAVTTPFEFSVVLNDFLPIMDKVSVMLEDLPELTPHLSEAHTVPGSCCLWKSDSKNKWCRTEIVKDDTAVVLNLVDYGYCVGLPHKDRSELKMLPEELMNLPKVTYPCILRGMRPGGDKQWTDEAAVFFQKCLYQKHLQIFFREFVSNSHWTVDLLADGAHVARELVDSGHAKYVDVMLGLRFQEHIPCTVPVSSDRQRACEQEAENSDSNPSAKGRKLLSSLSGSTQCEVM